MFDCSVSEADIDASAAVSSDVSMTSEVDGKPIDVCKIQESSKTVLDLYSGCGAMSTGLCLGAQLCGQRLVTVSQNWLFLLIFTESIYYTCSIFLLLLLFFFFWINCIEMGSWYKCSCMWKFKEKSPRDKGIILFLLIGHFFLFLNQSSFKF